MDSKKANWAFLVTIVCYIGMVFAVSLHFTTIADSLVFSNLLCEIVVAAPIFIFALASKEKPGSFLGFHKMKFRSVLMTVLFTFLSMPLLSLLNLITQIWVENEVMATMESMDVGQMPFVLLYLSTGVIAPIFEELTCRGAYYHSYRRKGSGFGAMLLSALIFALIHMNFNQAAYAFAMGILSVLLMEATGSLWSCVLYHGLVNGSQMVLLYGALKINPNVYSEQVDSITPDFLIYAITIYLIITVITLPLSWAVLVWIGSNEGRRGALSQVLPRKGEKRERMVTVPLLLAVFLCIGMMTGIFFALYMRMTM